jgi:hypothetical protein
MLHPGSRRTAKRRRPARTNLLAGYQANLRPMQFPYLYQPIGQKRPARIKPIVKYIDEPTPD